jgi:hypothetical protein
MVTLSIMKKHLARGQDLRALNDNNHALGICIEMLQVSADKEEKFHSPLYAGDALIRSLQTSSCQAVKHQVDKLKSLVTQPVSPQKIVAMMDFSQSVLGHRFSDVLEKISPVLDRYNDLVIKPLSHSSKTVPPLGVDL